METGVMPLAFESRNRGRVAFGFFQIESDMLLLEECFFFASAFCERVGEAALGEPGGRWATTFPGHVIERPEDVGDLLGAIHGRRFTGFIGETYRRYPFPAREEDFKQNPEGFRTRAELLEIISPFADEREIAFETAAGEVRIGDVRFSRAGFHELVRYVWRGGYPRWRDDVRPAYVHRMKAEIERSRHELFRGLSLTTPG
jgi:hypothetical protein